MTDQRDQFFNNLFDDAANAQTGGFQRQLSYENRIVRRVFNECGVKPASGWGRIVNMCKAETGTHEFSCAWFNSTFPRFPATLCGKRIGYCGYRRDDAGNKTSLSLYQLALAEILAAKHNVLIRTLTKALQAFAVDLDRPFAFVFPVVRKFFVAHNMDLPIQPANNMPRVFWTYSSPEGGVMRVEHSAPFFAAIGGDWFEID